MVSWRFPVSGHLLYNADVVPVGLDQLQRLEIVREVSRRFNYLYGDIFPDFGVLPTNRPVMPGADGWGVSRSCGNAIHVSDPPEAVEAKVRATYTDSTKPRRTDQGTRPAARETIDGVRRAMLLGCSPTGLTTPERLC